MDPKLFNDWRVVLLSPWPGWVVALAIVAAVLGVAFAAVGLRKERRPLRRWGLLALRTCSMVLALFLLLEPGVRYLQTATVKGRLAILLDGSASMELPATPGQAPRASEAVAFLQAVEPSLSALEDRYSLEFYRFGTELTPIRRGEGGEGRGEEGTDLLGALQSIPKGSGGRRLAGALVVSDGADNASLSRGLGSREREALRALGHPVSAVAVAAGKVRDLAIESLRVEDFAFVRNTVELEVALAATEMGNIEVPVVLKKEGQVVAQRSARIVPGESRTSVTLSFVPDQIGEFVFTVSVPVYEGEATAANNTESFVLKVIRDRVRTLHVVGRPSWDQRYLRTLLRNDPNVDLVSFYILRTQQDQPKATENELSLIPFPVDEIFEKQLWSFDLVVFQNFNYRPYRMDRYLPNIRKYVEDGGAFVMIGGESSFGEGGYDESPIGDILPVRGAGAAPNENPFAPRLTEAGMRHPITQLGRGGEANQSAWSRLPPIPGINVTAPNPGAQVLLDHPHVLAAGQNAPLLAVREVGRGRTLALTTDASWYWSLVASREGSGSSRAYEKFWSNAIRWLVRDPELTQVRVQAVQRTVDPETPVAAHVTVRRQDYAPAEGAAIEARLVEAESGKVLESRAVVSGQDGIARVEFPPPGIGPFRIVAEARDGGTLLGTGQDVVAVRAASLERSDIRPKPELLREVAEVTGGGFVASASRKLPELSLREPEVVEVGRSEDRPIWDRLWPLLALAGCLGAEWILRRRWGYA